MVIKSVEFLIHIGHIDVIHFELRDRIDAKAVTSNKDQSRKLKGSNEQAQVRSEQHLKGR